VQKLLAKINYLRHFIANLAGKVDPLLPLVRLRHEKDFVWGQEQRDALEKIREYLTSSPMLKHPKSARTSSYTCLPKSTSLGRHLHKKMMGNKLMWPT
jgi:hypothetical protein